MDGPLTLEALGPHNAEELAALLGEPVADWERRAAGWPHWHNWIVRVGVEPAGYVQATVREDATEVAWVIAEPWRGRGYATEAATAMLAQLGAVTVIAHIDPANAASEAVARRLGMTPGPRRDDGERRWSLPVERRQQ